MRLFVIFKHWVVQLLNSQKYNKIDGYLKPVKNNSFQLCYSGTKMCVP